MKLYTLSLEVSGIRFADSVFTGFAKVNFIL